MKRRLLALCQLVAALLPGCGAMCTTQYFEVVGTASGEDISGIYAATEDGVRCVYPGRDLLFGVLDGDLYVCDRSGETATLLRLAHGEPEIVAEGLGTNVSSGYWSLALSDSYVYLTEPASDGRSVFRINLDTGEREDIPFSVFSFLNFGMQNDTVYTMNSSEEQGIVIDTYNCETGESGQWITGEEMPGNWGMWSGAMLLLWTADSGAFHYRLFDAEKQQIDSFDTSSAVNGVFLHQRTLYFTTTVGYFYSYSLDTGVKETYSGMPKGYFEYFWPAEDGFFVEYSKSANDFLGFYYCSDGAVQWDIRI